MTGELFPTAPGENLQPWEVGQARKVEGIARRIDNDEEWHATALERLHWFARQTGTVTCDSFRAYATTLPEPGNPNSWGALFSAAAKAGWLRDTGRVEKTKRPSGQARRIVVWEFVRDRAQP